MEKKQRGLKEDVDLIYSNIVQVSKFEGVKPRNPWAKIHRYINSMVMVISVFY